MTDKEKETTEPKTDDLLLYPGVKADVIISSIGAEGDPVSVQDCDVFAKFDDANKTIIILARDPNSENRMVQITLKK